MKIIKISNLNINSILSLPKDGIEKHRETIAVWLNKNYPAFKDVILNTKQHGGESMLIHVLNFLMDLETEGMSPERIFNTRISIIHHDIDRLNFSKRDEKRSSQAVNSWKGHLSPDLKLNDKQSKEIEFLIKNHDVLGYFMRTFTNGLNSGVQPKEMMRLWIGKHPDVNTKDLLQMVFRMNVSDNNSGGGLSEEVKRTRKENISNLYEYLKKTIE